MQGEPEPRIKRSSQSHITSAIRNQAPSGFSWVAGVLNRKCVVAFSSYAGTLRNWIVHNDGRFRRSARRALEECIKKSILRR